MAGCYNVGVKHRWIGKVEPEAISADELAELVDLVMPGIDPSKLQPMTGGFRNWNYRTETSSGSRVLRIYSRGDRSAWKEQRLAQLVAPKVKTPKYLAIAEAGERVVAVREFMTGTVLHELFLTGSLVSPDMARAVGSTLAQIHQFEFAECGELDSDLNITERYDMSGAGILGYVRCTLETSAALQRLGPALAHKLLTMFEQNCERLDAWSGRPALIHGDFGPTNLVVAADGSVSVLDWEFSCSATPALDFGNLLRPPLENDDTFTQELAAGYHAAGGCLPKAWRQLALLADVTAWVSFLARPRIHELVLADARERIEHSIAQIDK